MDVIVGLYRGTMVENILIQRNTSELGTTGTGNNVMCIEDNVFGRSKRI
jgi:hypothetical protein